MTETLDPKTHPCPCVEHHTPSVHRTQGHHVLPQYAGRQSNRSTQPGFTPIQALCPTAHDTVHMKLDQWAMEEAAYLADGGAPGEYQPPQTGSSGHSGAWNRVIHSIALQGWKLFKKYWPDQPFPRENAPKPSG